MQLLFTVDGACVWSVRDGHGGCRDLEGAGAFVRFENPKKNNKKNAAKTPFPKIFCVRLSRRSFALLLTLFLSSPSKLSPPPPRIGTPLVAQVHICPMSAMRIYNALTGRMTEANPDEFLR